MDEKEFLEKLKAIIQNDKEEICWSDLILIKDTSINLLKKKNKIRNKKFDCE